MSTIRARGDGSDGFGGAVRCAAVAFGRHVRRGGCGTYGRGGVVRALAARGLVRGAGGRNSIACGTVLVVPMSC